MEDFIKILIWVIIIISFLGSIFKKKNKEKPKTIQNPQRDPEIRTNIPVKVESQPREAEDKGEIDSYNDMLAEIENLFKKDNEPSSSMSGSIPAEGSLKAKTSDKTRIQTHEAQKMTTQYDPQWHKETASEHTLITDWGKEEKVLEKKASADFNIENKANKFEEMMNQKPEPIGIFKHTIKEKLNHPATLKDYILMSEIIGKPKAKRR
jgi:hypothetical protein